MKAKYILLFLILLLIIPYFIKSKQADFFKNYSKKDTASKSLNEFYTKSTKTITVNGNNWKYYVGGNSNKTILFLHGMGGAYDLWWQQIHFFEKQNYKVISYTLPENIANLEEATKGIIAILDNEQIKKVNLVGTSMGGYITQYLVKIIPDRIEKAVFGNTFPPNKDILQDNFTKSKIVPLLPEIVIKKFGEKSLNEKLIPAAENDTLLKAFLPSLPFSKKSFINRFKVVVDPFVINPCKYKIKRIPKLIIESDNDPLVKQKLRNELKELYPDATVFTFHNKGHFPYINESDSYNRILEKFFKRENEYKNVETCVNKYFNGRKNANQNLLKEAFFKNALLFGTINKITPTVMPFSEYLKTVNEQGKQKVNTKIITADISNNMAFCKTEFNYPDKTYIDYLTLLKKDNTWKIISKTFVRK